MAETRLVVRHREQLWTLLVEAALQMYYKMGNFVPWRTAAWVLLSERTAMLSRQCSGIATQDGVPAAVSSAATTAAAISGQLAGHVPQELRPA